MYKLVIQDDEGKTTVVPLIRDELTIGRKEGNTIRLTERNVSRRHARLIRQNGSITIEDLESYNGIRVNGSRIQGRCQIRETDRVQIGDYLIELKSEAQDKADTMAERTVPIDRIDPHATTPVPNGVEPNDSALATTRMNKTEAAAILGAGFTAAVTEPMETLSDTDPGANPVAAAGAPAPLTPPAQPVAHPGEHARLVVLSTGLAGREFELDKPAMVIGRTEDNDVCVNHRSISRHHAKVVRENGRFAIVDLQSSNGVRVNGEEYGKVELRRADVIDLGHVRLRFVEAGEDFLFGRDAHAVDVVPQGSSRLAMWFALALLVVGAAVVTTTDSSTAAPSDEVSKLLDTARKAVEAEKWNVALTAAKAALDADPTNRTAQGLMDQAQSELATEQVYKQFLRAVASKDYTKVAELFRRLDPESVYRVMGLPDHDRLKQEYVAKNSREGKRLADRSKCSLQEKLAAEVGRVWTDASRAVMSHPCKQPSPTAAVAAGTPAATGAVPPGGAPPDAEPTAGPPAPAAGATNGGGGTASSPVATAGEGDPIPAGATFQQLLEQAIDEAEHSSYGKSLRLCEAALEKKPNDQKALSTCGLAACRLKQQTKARKFVRKLTSTSRQQAVQQICAQEHILDI